MREVRDRQGFPGLCGGANCRCVFHGFNRSWNQHNIESNTPSSCGKCGEICFFVCLELVGDVGCLGLRIEDKETTRETCKS